VQSSGERRGGNPGNRTLDGPGRDDRVADDTSPAGIPGPPSGVGPGVTTAQHPIHLIRPATRRPARCLHHTVWMACCDDCREAHAHVLDKSREQADVAD
jgi:hypothetical protein